MTTKRAKAKLVDAQGATIVVEPVNKGFELPVPDVPLAVVVDVARMGVQFGIGLAVLAVENAQRIALEAIDRGAKIEKKGIAAFSEFEQTQVTYMKDYLRKVRARTAPSNAPSIEVSVEEALKTHDVPTRDDIRELKQQISALGAKLK